jgi:hypothetical protein
MFSMIQRDIQLIFLNVIRAWVGDLADTPAVVERDP